MTMMTLYGVIGWKRVKFLSTQSKKNNRMELLLLSYQTFASADLFLHQPRSCDDQDCEKDAQQGPTCYLCCHFYTWLWVVGEKIMPWR